MTPQDRTVLWASSLARLRTGTASLGGGGSVDWSTFCSMGRPWQSHLGRKSTQWPGQKKILQRLFLESQVNSNKKYLSIASTCRIHLWVSCWRRARGGRRRWRRKGRGREKDRGAVGGLRRLPERGKTQCRSSVLLHCLCILLQKRLHIVTTTSVIGKKNSNVGPNWWRARVGPKARSPKAQRPEAIFPGPIRPDKKSPGFRAFGPEIYNNFYQGCQVVRAKICPIELQNMPNYAPARKCPPNPRFFMFYCIFINKFYPGLYILEISPLKVAWGKICPKSDLFRWRKILKKKNRTTPWKNY